MIRQRVLMWGLPALVVILIVALLRFAPTGLALIVLGAAFVVALVVFAGWRKLLQLMVVLLLVTFFAAMLIRLIPGDTVTAQAATATEEQREQFRENIGLKDPFFVQYWNFLTDFARGDLGNYLRVEGEGQPVSERLGNALPVTIQLILYAQLLALLFAIPLGILTAYKANSAFDKVVNTTAFGALSIPNFVLAYFLIYFLAVQRDLFPTAQYTEFGEDTLEHFRTMFLPAVSLAVGQIAIYMRLLRSDMVQTLQEDFITMARSKGLTTRRILLRHALRPSSFSLLTVAAINIGALIGGAVIIEVIFNLPGMGTLIFDAIRERQYVALQSFVAVIGVGYVMLNAIVDLLYSVLDPRIRHARAAT